MSADGLRGADSNSLLAEAKCSALRLRNIGVSGSDVGLCGFMWVAAVKTWFSTHLNPLKTA